MDLNRPIRIVASHKIQRYDVAAATRALESEPFSFRRGADNDQTAIGKLFARVDRGINQNDGSK
jgi:hypothetical protein